MAPHRTFNAKLEPSSFTLDIHDLDVSAAEWKVSLDSFFAAETLLPGKEEMWHERKSMILSRAELKDMQADKAPDILARIRYFRETFRDTGVKACVNLDLEVSIKEKTDA